MTWQPIGTAPRDGSDVILYCADTGGHAVQHQTMVGHWHDGRFVVMTAIGSGGYWVSSVAVMPWTHWMPIPKPPEDAA